jgi:hypothetical protein
MPNWCENTLTVEGEPQILRLFKERAKGKETALALAKLHPMPKELENTVSPGDNPNWYDWCVDNWGTKWDVEAKLIYEDEESLEYFFISAWSPPVAWLKKVARDYPKLRFRLKYEEQNIGFMGIAKAEKGKVKDTCIDTT